METNETNKVTLVIKPQRSRSGAHLLTINWSKPVCMGGGPSFEDSGFELLKKKKNPMRDPALSLYVHGGNGINGSAIRLETCHLASIVSLIKQSLGQHICSAINSFI